MDSIREGMNRRSIIGIQIKPDLQLISRLYANDTGFCLQMNEENFREVREKIAQFELASGALLNVQRSVISPMRDEDPPQWLETTGCIVAAPGERFKYLGLLSGRGIQAEEYTAHVKLKYEKKLKHWSLRILSWPERLIIISSILRAIPGYTMLSLEIEKKGIKELENVSRDFLWGWDQEGKAKKNLLAWDILGKSKEAGGLGWGSLEATADAYLVRNLQQIFHEDRDIWVEILSQIVIERVQTSQKDREIQDWSPHEVLICIKTLKTPRSNLANRMIKAWLHIHDSKFNGQALDENGMLQSVDWGLKNASTNPARLLLILSILRNNWTERNLRQFEGKISKLPNNRLLEETTMEATALKETMVSQPEWDEVYQRVELSLRNWAEVTARSGAGQERSITNNGTQITRNFRTKK
ncbi:hypothetical protein R1sor_011098 [Riccia sorocarpa]|uniref:Uncharacterized protein n=1 Tax=Riccia sorocarpa TaxID=122646 RepID=A0ABD3HZW9_9MARC